MPTLSHEFLAPPLLSASICKENKGLRTNHDMRCLTMQLQNLYSLRSRHSTLVARGSLSLSLQEKFEGIVERALPDNARPFSYACNDMSCTGITYEAAEALVLQKERSSQMNAPNRTSIDRCTKRLIPVKRITEFANLASPPPSLQYKLDSWFCKP